jgi:hypothetical protein
MMHVPCGKMYYSTPTPSALRGSGTERRNGHGALPCSVPEWAEAKGSDGYCLPLHATVASSVPHY